MNYDNRTELAHILAWTVHKQIQDSSNTFCYFLSNAYVPRIFIADCTLILWNPILLFAIEHPQKSAKRSSSCIRWTITTRWERSCLPIDVRRISPVVIANSISFMAIGTADRFCRAQKAQVALHVSFFFDYHPAA